MSIFQVITNKKFYIHLASLIVLIFLIFFGVLKGLDKYTRHGDVYLVPSLKGLTFEDIKDKGYEDFFDFVVTDSIYSKEFKPGAIVMQKPSPDSKVKKGRKIYVTVVAFGQEKVKMPNLVDLSLRQALVELKSTGLKVKQLDYVPNFAGNAVLAQLYMGDTIQPNQDITKGEAVTLIVGQGTTVKRIKVPLLVGKSLEQATEELHERSLNLGDVVYLDPDTIDAIVYKQYPGALYQQQLYAGGTVKLWLKSNKEFDVKSQIEELKHDSTEINWNNNFFMENPTDSTLNLNSDSLFFKGDTLSDFDIENEEF
ncbi:MAG: PASTA domain-containing protein [Bacteroidales bacterium]